MITEVRSDYYCESEGCTYIDIWIDDQDEGMSVAKVYDQPYVKVRCQPGKEMLFADPIVQEEIISVLEKYFEESLAR